MFQEQHVVAEHVHDRIDTVAGLLHLLAHACELSPSKTEFLFLICAQPRTRIEVELGLPLLEQVFADAIDVLEVIVEFVDRIPGSIDPLAEAFVAFLQLATVVPDQLTELFIRGNELLLRLELGVACVFDAQQEGAEQFRDALTEFKAVVNMPDTELERQYDKLNSAFKRSKKAAREINDRVDRVVAASNRLLDEWREELDDYNDPALRRLAEQQFDQTRDQAARLIASMREIEDRMQPVLASFQDQVLYLKHNLNLSAIAALEGEASVIESNVDLLIADMNRSIAEADAFIDVILDRDIS